MRVEREFEVHWHDQSLQDVHAMRGIWGMLFNKHHDQQEQTSIKNEQPCKGETMAAPWLYHVLQNGPIWAGFVLGLVYEIGSWWSGSMMIFFLPNVRHCAKRQNSHLVELDSILALASRMMHELVCFISVEMSLEIVGLMLVRQIFYEGWHATCHMWQRQ